MKIVIFDAFNGAGGDMIVSSLLNTTIDEEDLKSIIGRLNLNIGFKVLEVVEQGISAKRIQISSGYKKRKYSEVVDLIDSSDLERRVKEESKGIFKSMALAEGEIHGRDYKKAVFHEIGSDDAIFDVSASVTGILRLIDAGYSIYTTPIRLGTGFINIKHGKYPIPSPATLEIVKGSKLNVLWSGEGELFTPTAAAILSHFSKGEFLQPFQIENISYGSGSGFGEDKNEITNTTRKTNHSHTSKPKTPNVLRLILGEKKGHDSIVVLETIIDDTTGEIISHAMDMVGKEVLDITAIPAIGKKGRPATILKVITESDRSEEIGRKIISETGSLGVRVYPVHHRIIADRAIKEANLEIDGKVFSVRVKKAGNLLKPEFEDVKKISESLKKPLIVTYRIVLEKIGE